jgi:hypothetical protein
VGYSGATLASLFQPQNFLVNTAVALAVSIFDGGVKRGEQAFAQSYYEEMVETYGKTVLQAVRDVEGAQATLKTVSRRLEAQKAVTRSALNIFKIGSEAYAAGAIDQTAMLESRKNYQRSADETQRVKAELLRSYATLAYALGFGASVVEAGSSSSDRLGHASNLSDDLHVGLNGGVPALVAFGSSVQQPVGSWEVDLPGVYHRSGLLPLWRDLRARFAVGDNNLTLRAVHLDHIDGITESNEAWYRLSAYGFAEQNAATTYCNELREAGQNCSVEMASASNRSSSKFFK